MLGKRHHRRDRRLVVAAQKRRAVGQNQVLSDVCEKIRKLRRRHRDALRFVQNDPAAVVVFEHPRTDVRAGRVGRGVHVRDKADGASAARRHRRRQFCIDHAGGFVQIYVVCADRVELVEKHPRKIELLLRGRRGFAASVGLRIDLRIADQPLLHLFVKLRSFVHAGILS